MKVIDAFWEKRNLGVDTVEFEAEKGDTPDIIRQTILSNEKQYNVVKVPSGDFAIKTMLAELGYIYVESMFKLSHKMKMPEIPAAVKRIADRITYLPMTDEDIEQLFAEIEKGIFKTDRIAIDPYFSPEIANRRYINWIKDEIARGNWTLKGVYEGEAISFGAYKMLDNNICFPFLGGQYVDYQNSGLAMPATYKSIETVLAKKPSRVITYVSGNNYNAMMCNIDVGFVIKDTSDVYIKHKE